MATLVAAVLVATALALVVGGLAVLAKALDLHRAALVVAAATETTLVRELHELTTTLKSPLRVDVQPPPRTDLQDLPAVGGRH